MRDLRTYVIVFFTSMKNVFSILSLPIYVGLFFVPELGAWKEQVQNVALAIAFFSAGYFAWKRDRKPIEDYSELRVSVSEPALGVHSFRGGGRLAKLHICFDADITNPRHTICFVERPKLDKFQMGTDLFSRSKGKMKITQKNERVSNIPFPMKLSPLDHTILQIQIEIETTFDDPKVIARAMKSLNTYSLEFIVCYSFTPEEKDEIRCLVSGDYDDVRQSVLKNWQDNNFHELLCIANGIKC
ncbi:conserved hypothetical protein [delta proteobacterium NaphS2]|nr:conserved hypothetical protein [delta proteobacterium NaphS2]